MYQSNIRDNIVEAYCKPGNVRVRFNFAIFASKDKIAKKSSAKISEKYPRKISSKTRLNIVSHSQNHFSVTAY